MCGRYALADTERLEERFQLQNRPLDTRPSWNAAPGQIMPVVTRHSPNRLEMMKWGLVPSWAKDPKIGYKMINARTEGIQDKPSFRTAIRKRRCLVPSSGYFEWKKEGIQKVPYYFRLKDQGLFAFAGLYEAWHDAEGRELMTYTIITTAPNRLAAEVHDRMPVILRKEQEDEWLDPDVTDAEQVVRLLGTYDAEAMVSFPVSSLVGSPAHNDPSLIVPLEHEQPSALAGRDSK